MPLRGKEPTHTDKRLKALFYGEPSSGKTYTAIHFPRVYLIDTEKGSHNKQYVEIIKQGKGQVFNTTDFNELLAEVKELLQVQHPYKTLIIDPFTIVYQDLCDRWAQRLAAASKDPNSDGTEFQRHRDRADTQVKQLLRLLLRLDMNVIITAHAKTKWQKSGKELIDVGNTFDAYKKLDYLFDLVFEVQRRGDQYIGIVKKSRVLSFPNGDQFQFSYDEIANRYGREILERDAVCEKLATKDQVARLKELIELYKEPEEVVDKWLDKAGAETIEDLSFDIITKLINAMEARVKPKGEK